MSPRTRKAPSAPPPLEKVVQQQIAQLFRAAGGKVRSTSQTRASRVAVGIPDLMIHFPEVGRFLWFEVKTYARPWRPTEPMATWRVNPLSEDQMQFRIDCLDSGVMHRWGGLWQAEEVLVELGLGYRRPDGVLVVRRNSLTTPLARR